jgi:hypothetical protein
MTLIASVSGASDLGFRPHPDSFSEVIELLDKAEHNSIHPVASTPSDFPGYIWPRRGFADKSNDNRESGNPADAHLLAPIPHPTMVT